MARGRGARVSGCRAGPGRGCCLADGDGGSERDAGANGSLLDFLYANGRGSGGWEEPGDSHPERIGHYFLALLLLRGIVFWQEILARNGAGRARGKGGESPANKEPPKPSEPLGRAGGLLSGAGCLEVSFAVNQPALQPQDTPLPPGPPCPHLVPSPPAVMPPGPLPQTWGRASSSPSPKGCSQGGQRLRDARSLGTPPPWQRPSPQAEPSPGSPLQGAEGCCWQSRAIPGELQPLGGLHHKRRFPLSVCPRAFDIPSPGTFFWGQERGTGPAPAGTSLPLRSCLHLETPSKSYVGVDLPKREKQQASRWDHNAAPAQFGYFWDF